MKTTVASPGLDENRSQEREVFKLVNEAKAALDFRHVSKQRLVSTGASAFESFRFRPWGDIPDDTAWAVSAQVVGVALTGRCTFQMEGLFYRASAAALQQGATSTTVSIRSSVLMDAQFVVLGNGLVVQAKDGGMIMGWTLVVEISEVK